VAQKRGKAPPLNIGVLDSLDSMGEIFDEGVEKLRWTVLARNGNKRVEADFVPETRPKIQARMQKILPLADTSKSQGTTFEGLLELADGKFKIINPAAGSPTLLNFGEDKADNVFDQCVQQEVEQPESRTIASLRVLQLLQTAHYPQGATPAMAAGITSQLWTISDLLVGGTRIA
jgi:hypothetical protein